MTGYWPTTLWSSVISVRSSLSLRARVFPGLVLTDANLNVSGHAAVLSSCLPPIFGPIQIFIHLFIYYSRTAFMINSDAMLTPSLFQTEMFSKGLQEGINRLGLDI